MRKHGASHPPARNRRLTVESTPGRYNVLRDGKPLRKVVKAVEAELRSESLPPDTLGQLDPGAVRLAKTASRSILGFMNEMAVHLRYQVADAGGLSHRDINALNHHLRRTLHNRGGYAHPIELVAQRLAARAWTIHEDGPIHEYQATA